MEFVIINKFGKAEAGGGGLRGEIAEAICKGLPLLTAVSTSNLDAWNAFMGDTVYVPVLEADFPAWFARQFRACWHHSLHRPKQVTLADGAGLEPI